MIWDFFKGLGRSRVEEARAKVQAKGMGAVAKAKGKAAQKFNEGVDKGINKAKDGAVGAAKKGADKAKGGQSGGGTSNQGNQSSGGKNMGIFGKKGGGNQSGGGQMPSPEQYDDARTRALNLDSFMDTRQRKECVGWVVALNGNHRGEDFRLVPGKNVMGTAADCDIVITDPYLSNQHATIRYEDGEFVVVDLDSTNGTYVNDKRISRCDLIDNDKIRLGRTELKFKSLF
ncbi:MAG: FHA domain-containing protein [Myxococcales bacterium]|nr:FHA domain-containing protein [Myxococcales bacterium]